MLPDVGPLANEAELDAFAKIMGQSFTTGRERTLQYVESVGRDNIRVIRSGGRVVAGLATFWMGHWFGGRSVPTCGIAAVGVAPEVRGTGVGKALMLGVLAEARERGVWLSTLYSSTQQLYRRVGYEQAGHRNMYRLDLRSLRPLGRDLQTSDLDPMDVATMAPLYTAWARTQEGLLDRNPAIWARVNGGENVYGALFGDPAAPEGYAIWQQLRDDSGFYSLSLRDRVTLTPAASRQLWTLFADHRSMASWLSMAGPGNEPSFIQLEEWRSAEAKKFERWMLRVVDIRGALLARGWPSWAAGQLDLDLVDDDFPDQGGRWRLEVAGGEAQIERGGSGGLRLDRRALAPLFSGLMSASQLANQGQIEVDDRNRVVAEALFAGSEPWLVDHF